MPMYEHALSRALYEPIIIIIITMTSNAYLMTEAPSAFPLKTPNKRVYCTMPGLIQILSQE